MGANGTALNEEMDEGDMCAAMDERRSLGIEDEAILICLVGYL